ncbi:MAG: hypothetical protein NXI20_22610 [bacterium]|nr:hypothetical protein [bacterium]
MRLSYQTLFNLLLIIFISCNPKPTTSNEETNTLIEESSEEQEASNEEQEAVTEESIIETEEISINKEEVFQEYVSFFQSDSLPVSFNPREYNMQEMACFQLLDYLDIREESGFSNSSFCPEKNLSTSDQFILLLSVEENFIYNAAPVLETYSPEGELINLKALDFRWEEAETQEIQSTDITINTDLTFRIESKVRTVELVEEQDENGNYMLNEVEGSEEISLESIDGHVDEKGIIHFEDQQSKTIE